MFMETGCGATYEIRGDAGTLLWQQESRQCLNGSLQRRLDGLGFLAQFARGVSASLNPREVVQTAARLLHNYFNYDLARLSLPGDSGKLSVFSALNEGLPELESWETDERGFREHAGCLDDDHAIVEIKGDWIKILLYCSEENATKASPELLTGIAESLTAALRNAREHERVKELSVRDTLTGLYNRRVLEEILTVEGSRRTPAPLAVMLIDVDDFKKINDTFGHPAGDRVLSVLGRLLRENCRKENIIARYGGEEFAVFLTNSGLTATAALQAAERLRTVLAAQDFAFSGRKVKLTVSIGVAFSTGKAGSSESLLGIADKALYQAKRAGKNRVCFQEAAIAGRSQRKVAGAERHPAFLRCG